MNRIIPLKEGGEHLYVTQENKREFVQLSAQYRLYSSIKEQIESFATGFYEIVPKDLLQIVSLCTAYCGVLALTLLIVQ